MNRHYITMVLAVAAGLTDQSFAAKITDVSVPVISRTDVLVVGSSLDGCFLARRIAAGGRGVVLTSAGTSLPREIAIGLRPWVRADRLAKAPADIKAFLLACGKRKDPRRGEIILNMIQVTEGMEDRVLDAGAGLYYDMHPCGVRLAGGRVTAVVFACKGGLVAIEAKAVVDCTPDARVAALAGAEMVQRPSADQGVVVRYSMLCKNPPGEGVLTHGDFAEFRMRLAAGKGHFAESGIGLAARRRAAAAGERKAGFVRGGDVVLADPTKRIVSCSAGSNQKLSLDACRPKGMDNLLVCGPTVDVADAVAKTLVEPLAGGSLADVIEKAPWEKLCKTRAGGKTRVVLSVGGPAGGAATGRAMFEAVGPIYRTGAVIRIDGIRLPVIADCDVLVVGAGTSGVPAAWVAARRGADTIAIEKYGDVGGTHTIGGVCKYWFGRRTDFVRRLDAAAGEIMAPSGMPKCMGMLGCLTGAGVRLVTHCMAVGTVVVGRTVTGVVVVTPAGLKVIRAKRVIDATGDGDVAARAGAATEYGTRRDAMTMWYSFARYRGTNPEAARHFDCVVDPRDPADMSRAMISSRRRGRARGPNDFPQYYLTPRESRHVRGKYTVTVADILAGRRFEDVAVVCEANFDVKGIADSDLFLSGYIEPGYVKNYAVQVPFRALQPTDLENILVVGRGYSVTHDALALARMQRDLMAMGGAAGLAAARAVKNDKSFSTLDVGALQKGLVEMGVLAKADLAGAQRVEDDELRRMVDRLAAGTLDLGGKVKILVRRRAAIPVLKRAFAKADGAGKVELAKALCFLGETRGADVLLAELGRRLAAKRLPMKMFKRQNPSPDHAYAPEICFLIHTLGRLGERRVIPHLATVAGRVQINPARSDMMFNYVFSVCYAAERLGDPACAGALAILADKPGLRGRALRRGTDPRKTQNRTADRYAYLEMCVARAMARCGMRRGYGIVIEYLGDTRGFLARSAHDELVALAGKDFGYDEGAWKTWVAAGIPGARPYRHASGAPAKPQAAD